MGKTRRAEGARRVALVKASKRSRRRSRRRLGRGRLKVKDRISRGAARLALRTCARVHVSVQKCAKRCGRIHGWGTRGNANTCTADGKHTIARPLCRLSGMCVCVCVCVWLGTACTTLVHVHMYVCSRGYDRIDAHMGVRMARRNVSFAYHVHISEKFCHTACMHGHMDA
eukprot:347464-Chlamydomonas_euryale.AAC.5